MIHERLVIETNQTNIKSENDLSCGDQQSWKYILQLFNWKFKYYNDLHNDKNTCGGSRQRES